jgi:hypothetical protein
MKLHMNDEHSFQDIQREFSGLYPFLKLDFFKPFIGSPTRGMKTERIHPEERVLRFIKKVQNRIVNIEGYRTVAQVVKDIENMLALTVMILRRSGNLWIETSLTARWTLEQQNREGEIISQMT